MSTHIPEDAKKVYEGIIFDVFHFDVKLYDGSTATFEKLRRAYTLITIPLVGKKIALIKDEQPDRGALWAIPGGRIDPGEDELTGAKRELEEETGLVSNNWKPLRRYTPSNKIDWDIILFVAHDCTDTGTKQNSPGERTEVHLVDFDEFIDIVCGDDFVEKDFALEVLKLKCAGRLDELKKEIFG